MSSFNLLNGEAVFYVDTVGSAGSAIGSVSSVGASDYTGSRLSGLVSVVKLIVNASAPATTRVKIYRVTDVHEELILDVIDPESVQTTGIFRPVFASQDINGTDTATLVHATVEKDNIRVDVSGCDALTNAITVAIQLL